MPRPSFPPMRRLKALTLHDLIQELRYHSPAPSTIERWQRAIAKFEALAGAKPCSSISTWCVDRVCEALLKQASPSSVRSTLASLAALMQRGQRCGLLPATPNPFLWTLRARNLRPPERFDRCLSLDNLQQLFANEPYDQPLNAGPNAAWLPLFVLFTGARVDELLRARPHDLIYQDGMHLLQLSRGTLSGRSARSEHRLVRLPESLLACGVLHMVERRRGDGSQWLFAEGSDVAREAGRVRRWVARNLRTPSGPVTFQALRHASLAARHPRYLLQDAFLARSAVTPMMLSPSIFRRMYMYVVGANERHVLVADTPSFPGLDLSHLHPPEDPRQVGGAERKTFLSVVPG